MSLIDLLSRAADQTPEKLALRAFPVAGEEYEDWTFRRLFAAGEDAARRLVEAGVGPGDRVAVFLENRPELVTAYLGLLRLGAAMVPINLAYREREVGHILEEAEPRLALAEAEHLPLFASLGVDAFTPEGLSASGDERAAAARVVEAPAPEGDPPALLLFTSGTTGKSKGAVLTQANVAATVRALLEAWAWRPDDLLLLTLPLFHTHGLVVGLHCALAAGATVYLRRRFEAEVVLDALLGGKPTLFFGVPTMYVRLVEELRRRGGPPDLQNMRLFCSGSAPLDPETFAAFEALTGHAILERYGMTETGMLLSNPYGGPRVPGTVGRELPGVEARVVDEACRDLEDGEEGELLVRGANVFSGYWRSPEKTRQSFVDRNGGSWFRTGDLARRDPASGYYSLLGRRHELVITGGFNVYPREVEEVLTSLPGVLEAAVIGRPHPEWGEEVVAFLVTRDPIDRESLIEACKERMAAFKVPRRLYRIDELPRNALGKVQKHLLPVDAA